MDVVAGPHCVSDAAARRRVVVVGGGVAGLVAGATLRRAAPALDVVVLEAASRPGGKALTDLEDGWTLEHGPQTWLSDPALERAIDLADLRDEVVPAAPDARRRLLLSGGALVPVPQGVHRVLGLGGLARALGEPFVAVRPEGGEDESIHAFATRRFGERAARTLVGALVTGIWAGDPERLSVRSALPRLAALEATHGSVTRALLRRGLPARTTATLRRGLGSLGDGLARTLGPALRLRAPVKALEPLEAGAGGRWRVVPLDGPPLEAAAVVLATPSYAAADLVRTFDAGLAGQLEAIPWAPVAAVCLGYPEAAFRGGPPRGFGFLVPRGEARVLGCLFASSIAPGAAPPGHALLRVLIGGRLDPGALDLDDPALVELCRREVEPLLGIEGPPVLTRLFRHARAIPQYELGHAARLASIDAALGRRPGLHLTGNCYRGVSLGDVATDAERVAQAIGGALLPAG